MGETSAVVEARRVGRPMGRAASWLVSIYYLTGGQETGTGRQGGAFGSASEENAAPVWSPLFLDRFIHCSLQWPLQSNPPRRPPDLAIVGRRTACWRRELDDRSCGSSILNPTRCYLELISSMAVLNHRPLDPSYPSSAARAIDFHTMSTRLFLDHAKLSESKMLSESCKLEL